MGRSEIKNDLFELDSVLPTRGRQNKYLYRELLAYKQLRSIDLKKADIHLSNLLKWLDPLVVRYCWAAKKWPKREDFHESYYRDWYRLRDTDPIEMDKEDILQFMRTELVEKFRKYRVRYKTPPAGYASRALFYSVIKLSRIQKKQKKSEATKSE